MKPHPKSLIQTPRPTPREQIEELADTLQVPVTLPRSQSATMRELSPLLLRVLDEYSRRITDGLNLYRPLPRSVPFHASMAHTRLIVGPNQSSKTVSACAEISRIARGMDPFQKRKPRDLRILAVGKDSDHIGDTMWQKLWFPGLFDIVPDEITGAWRAVRPDPNDPTELDPIDLARKDQWKPSPPLLPPSAIRPKGIAWEKANQNIPRKVYLNNGTSIYFYSSLGRPRQGFEADLVWFDEEIEQVAWFGESLARLLKRDGIMLWSATPQAATLGLVEFHDRALDGDPDVDEFEMSLEENPYIPAPAKKRLYNALKNDPEQLAVRYYGHWAIKGRQIYSMFNMGLHGVEAFEIPDDWMRLLVIDPAAHVQAVLLAAVPPEADQIHVYGEVYEKNADARDLAIILKKRIGPVMFEVFILDQKAAQQRTMGHSYTVEAHYREQFEKFGLRARRFGSGFEMSSTEIDGRELSLKNWMRVRSDGETTLKVHIGACPQLEDQIKKRYRKKTDPSKRDDRVAHDCVDCLEYLAAYFDDDVHRTPFGLHYNAPSRVDDESESFYENYMNFKHRQSRRLLGAAPVGISLGPVGSP